MTEKLYYENAYATKFTACVVSCREAKEGYHIVLDRTLFYPEGGGQPADRGILGETHIRDVRENDGEIIHYADKPLTVGVELIGEIDWQRRFDHMQNHSGEHILSGVICKKYSCDNVGFHMGKDVITIDLNYKIPDEDIPLLEEKANKAIWSNIPVEEFYPDSKELDTFAYRSKKELTGQVRIVRVGEYDCCACCGTHVKTAGEIGIIKIISAQNYKGGTRLELLCGKRALDYCQRVSKAAADAGKALSVQEDKIDEAVQRLLAEKDALTETVSKWKYKCFKKYGESINETFENILVTAADLNSKDMTALGDMLAEKTKGRVMVMTPAGEGFNFVLLSRKGDARDMLNSLKVKFDCKGGGKPEAVQGSLKGDKDSAEEFFKGEGFFVLRL